MLAAVNDAAEVVGQSTAREPEDALEARLGNGFRAGLHEIHVGTDDSGTGIGFALMLAIRKPSPGPVIWVRDDRSGCGTRLYGHGIAELGLDPARLLLVTTPDPVAALRATREAMACNQVAAVVLESKGKFPQLDLTASRRLHWAAVQSGVIGISLRIGGEAVPSAAMSRWRVTAAQSEPLPGMAPGRPRLVVELQRHRAGVPAFEMMVEWDHHVGRFSARGLGRGDKAVADMMKIERRALGHAKAAA